LKNPLRGGTTAAVAEGTGKQDSGETYSTPVVLIFRFTRTPLRFQVLLLLADRAHSTPVSNSGFLFCFPFSLLFSHFFVYSFFIFS
jgi:hypothetical protein